MYTNITFKTSCYLRSLGIKITFKPMISSDRLQNNIQT